MIQEKAKNFGTVIPFIVTIVVLTMGAAAAVLSTDRGYVMANWSDFRCKVGPLFTAYLYKPSGDTRTRGEFAKDNFDFCMRQFQKEGVDTAFSPVNDILEKQINAAGTVQENQNTSKQVMHNLLDSTVGKVLSTFYKQLEIFAQNVANIFQRMKMAYHRIEAVLLAVVYAGISMMKAILNGIDFVILVVLIILLILIIIIILLFFFMFYSIPVILITIAALVSVGVGVGYMSDTFCFDGNTRVEKDDGSYTNMRDLKIGDILKGGGKVDGMYEFDATHTELYDLSGIKVSGDHIVWDSISKKWISVDTLNGPRMSKIRTDRVYCPTVSNRLVPVINNNGNTIWFRDWEEIDENDEGGYIKWDKMINDMLNDSTCGIQRTPTEINAFGEGIKVVREYLEVVPINEIKIGDKVLTKDNKYVRVTGVYKELCERAEDKEWIGDGVWVYENNKWIHPAKNTSKCSELYGWNLITEGGEFMIICKGEKKLVRDALEVGTDGIKNTYEFIKNRLDGY